LDGVREAITFPDVGSYLAVLMLQATAHLPRKPIATDAKQVRADILAAHGTVDLASALRYVWDHGLPVLPLDDPGTFHGACWRAGGRNVIALKRRNPSFARWLQLLLHEFRHAAEEPERDEFIVLEEQDTPDTRRESIDERRANQFAADVMLDGRAEDLVKECVDRTK
ncbi:MAG: ImmA/IrrE family metallo-endopeptidase, partial [Singulisphaera sp.]